MGRILDDIILDSKKVIMEKIAARIHDYIIIIIIIIATIGG